MTPLENLYLAIGELAYTAACADGTIQKEEYEKFKDILNTTLGNKSRDVDSSAIIFKVVLVHDKLP